jgi:hypothetical protein
MPTGGRPGVSAFSVKADMMLMLKALVGAGTANVDPPET